MTSLITSASIQGVCNALSFRVCKGSKLLNIGVGHTTPRVNIFPSASDFLLMQTEGPISMNTSTESLGRLFGQNQITSALSEMHPKRNYFEHLSTPEVATDMLSIVKAYGMEKLQFYGFS